MQFSSSPFNWRIILGEDNRSIVHNSRRYHLKSEIRLIRNSHIFKLTPVDVENAKFILVQLFIFTFFFYGKHTKISVEYELYNKRKKKETQFHRNILRRSEQISLSLEMFTLRSLPKTFHLICTLCTLATTRRCNCNLFQRYLSLFT